ncbi:DNA-binding transcriptional activator MhpR [Roseivivax jejudonensis]|uniref:DNA-binding transcriptional activator MhpR n=1 Tax=Roseivivax jejudonensis TaxID=1529041 RepID=A0A1X7A5K2_9RHOB|nr:helix-turn-helix domain-containing protein [Roseivivax jejudonensis]SLN70914.1 DNA-binding transcriptional activator MhpR [Roseivivax jejudonensis]
MKQTQPDDPPGGALARGLRLLVALNDVETATISSLVDETSLAKPTLIRLLHTLVEQGYAQHDEETMTYAVTPKVASLSRALVGRGAAGARTQEVLDRLADDTKWPTEWLARDGGSMVVQGNNRERAPIRLKLFERRRFPLLTSASGLAQLAGLPLEEADALIESHATEPAMLAKTRSAVVEARKRGYATRLLRELGPNMIVAAVPIPDEGGALALIHFDDVVDDKTFRTTLLPRLQDAAHAMGKALAGHDQ